MRTSGVIHNQASVSCGCRETAVEAPYITQIKVLSSRLGFQKHQISPTNKI